MSESFVIRLNGTSARFVEALSSELGFTRCELSAPAMSIATGPNGQIVSAIVRFGHRGADDYQLSLDLSLEPEQLDNVIGELATRLEGAAIPFELSRDPDATVIAASDDFVDRLHEVEVEGMTLRSPLYNEPRRPDTHWCRLGGREYSLDVHVSGFGSFSLWLGECEGDRYLVSIATAPVTDARALEAAMRFAAEGLLPFTWFGPLDGSRGWALVEAIGDGTSASRLVLPLEIEQAAGLAAQVGAVLLRLARAGSPLFGVRPELITVARGHLLTGVTDRPARLFAAARPAEFSNPVWLRTYAPRERPLGERALPFSLALLLTEWATNCHPIENRLWGDCSDLKPTRAAAVDELPPGLADLVRRALDPDPALRPDLEAMLAALQNWRG